uniref:Protein Asterix n=1 Tax=Steinernema glaseri TaxID=37863 RepID=A0A1I7YW36_9BILA
MIAGNCGSDLRRPNRIVRFKPMDPMSQAAISEDPIPEYMNVLGMICSMMGLMMRIKWFSWSALFCSCVCFANTRSSDDAKQIVSSFMLSVSAVVMCYLQNPSPIIPPWVSMY